MTKLGKLSLLHLFAELISISANIWNLFALTKVESVTKATKRVSSHLGFVNCKCFLITLTPT